MARPALRATSCSSTAIAACALSACNIVWLLLAIAIRLDERLDRALLAIAIRLDERLDRALEPISYGAKHDH